MSRQALLALLVCLIVWASAFVMIRVAITVYGPADLALFRFIIAAIILAGYIFKTGQYRQRLRLRELGLCLLIGAGLAGYLVGLNTGEQHLDAATASFIVNTEPLLIAAFAFLLFKEPFTHYHVVGIVVSLIGISLIFYSNHHHLNHSHWPIIVVLLATLSSTLYVVLQKPLVARYAPGLVLTYYIWGGMLICLPALPHLIQHLQQAPLHVTLAAVYLGLFPTVIGFGLWTYSMKHLPMSYVASGLYVIPFITIILGWLILGETMHWMAFIGGCLALIGAIFVNYPALKSLAITKLRRSSLS